MRRIGVYVCMGLARIDPPGAEHGQVVVVDGARVTVRLANGEARVYEVDGDPNGWFGRSVIVWRNVMGWRSPRGGLAVLAVTRRA